MRIYDGMIDCQWNKVVEGDLSEECKLESIELMNCEDGVMSVCGNVFY